ncbi:MAG: glycerophosphodiester phosphodiesterase family protein [Bacteroidota bacterium]
MRLFILMLFLPLAVAGQYAYPVFDIQGHRGARGIRPENTIPAFITALDSGVTTLEMDLAVSRDGKIIVSHEPWMNATICRKPDGSTISEQDQQLYNLFQMDYADIRQWDCGSAGNPRFPRQHRIAVCKPLLRDVIAAAEDHLKGYTRYEVDYNMEIKSDSLGDGIFHPPVAIFADMVVKMVDEYLPLERVTIQSFDFRVLRYLHEHHPQVRLSALTFSDKPVEEELARLGFVPDVWSPLFTTLDRRELKHLHELKPDSRPEHRLRVIPWTVNEEKDMLSMKGMGTDGFITDYPDVARKFRNTLRIKPRKDQD